MTALLFAYIVVGAFVFLVCWFSEQSLSRSLARALWWPVGGTALLLASTPDFFADVVAKLSPDIQVGGFSDDYYKIWKIISRNLGLGEHWSHCPRCQGEGLDPTVQAVYEAWAETPVPEGPGYQLWETVSEGSPVSPVFEKAEEMAQWLAANAGARSIEAALRWVHGPGWAPSGIFTPKTGCQPGIAAMTQE